MISDQIDQIELGPKCIEMSNVNESNCSHLIAFNAQTHRLSCVYSATDRDDRFWRAFNEMHNQHTENTLFQLETLNMQIFNMIIINKYLFIINS